MVADCWQDLRYSARMLVKNSGFSLITIIMLPAGIGANTAVFLRHRHGTVETAAGRTTGRTRVPVHQGFQRRRLGCYGASSFSTSGPA